MRLMLVISLWFSLFIISANAVSSTSTAHPHAECPDNSYWSECYGRCKKTCFEKRPSFCDMSCESGCICVNPYVFDETNYVCVNPNDCEFTP